MIQVLPETGQTEERLKTHADGSIAPENILTAVSRSMSVNLARLRFVAVDQSTGVHH